MAKALEQSPLQELKASIKNSTPANFYVFYGEEMFLLNHYLQQLKKCVLEELTESFNFHRFTSETFDLRQFADAVENLPMMADRTLVQVDDIDLFKFNEDSRNHLVEILTDIPEYCTVVFTYDTVEWKPDKRLKKLWDAVQAAQIVEFAKQSQRDLISWITRHFTARKKSIAPELCAYLLEITDGTMTSLSSEIEKIVAYSDADRICKTDIDAVTEPVLDAVVYRMTDQISAGDFTAALQTMEKLMKMQQDPILLLAAIGSHLRQISTARALLDHGKNASDLGRLYPKMPDFAARRHMETARRMRSGFFARTAELVLETDYQMKTSFDDPQRLLELMILRLAQEARNG